jgi:hypothetical protein
MEDAQIGFQFHWQIEDDEDVRSTDIDSFIKGNGK